MLTTAFLWFAITQGRRKLVRTGAAIHWDIGGRVTRNFKVLPCKSGKYFQRNFMMATVVYTNSSAEIGRAGVGILEWGESK